VIVNEMSLQKGHRDDVNVIYNTGPPIIFSNKHYAAALEKLASSRYQPTDTETYSDTDTQTYMDTNDRV